MRKRKRTVFSDEELSALRNWDKLSTVHIVAEHDTACRNFQSLMDWDAPAEPCKWVHSHYKIWGAATTPKRSLSDLFVGLSVGRIVSVHKAP